MSEYYKARRVKGLFDPESAESFRLSRSKIDLFLNCPRCFYLDRRLGIGQPPGYPFNLNSAVDHLLKKEFDLHRARGKAHPLMEKYGVDAVPLKHLKLNEWRENFKGVQALHQPTNFLVTGAIDDLWTTPNGEIIVVDYKATAKDGEVNLDAEWQDGYKRQMEVYQWILRHCAEADDSKFKVSDIGYFVYCNGLRDKEAFDAKLEFDVKIIPYEGNDSWVDKTLVEARGCLDSSEIPLSGAQCDFCAYREAAMEVEGEKLRPRLRKRASKMKTQAALI